MCVFSFLLSGGLWGEGDLGYLITTEQEVAEAGKWGVSDAEGDRDGGDSGAGGVDGGAGNEGEYSGVWLVSRPTAAVVGEQEHAKTLSWFLQYSSIVNGDQLLSELMKCQPRVGSDSRLEKAAWLNRQMATRGE